MGRKSGVDEGKETSGVIALSRAPNSNRYCLFVCLLFVVVGDQVFRVLFWAGWVACNELGLG